MHCLRSWNDLLSLRSHQYFIVTQNAVALASRTRHRAPQGSINRAYYSVVVTTLKMSGRGLPCGLVDQIICRWSLRSLYMCYTGSYGPHNTCSRFVNIRYAVLVPTITSRIQSKGTGSLPLLISPLHRDNAPKCYRTLIGFWSLQDTNPYQK